MNRKEALEKLAKLQGGDDPEAEHSTADDILCDLLESLGYSDVVEAYQKVDKWYA